MKKLQGHIFIYRLKTWIVAFSLFTGTDTNAQQKGNPPPPAPLTLSFVDSADSVHKQIYLFPFWSDGKRRLTFNCTATHLVTGKTAKVEGTAELSADSVHCKDEFGNSYEATEYVLKEAECTLIIRLSLKQDLLSIQDENCNGPDRKGVSFETRTPMKRSGKK